VTISGYEAMALWHFTHIGSLISTLGIQARDLDLIPGSCHYSTGQPWASCLLTLPLQFLSSKKLEYKKGVFGA